jgi:16S rRNA C1402 N4-methylase RsmH
LLQASVDGLNIKQTAFVDVTFGGGGHSKKFKDSGQTEAIFDQDEDALDALPDEDFTYQ